MHYFGLQGWLSSAVLSLAIITIATSTWAATQSSYAGQETRMIKALSAQAIEGYLQGAGLGYAKAAELNHYPGPRHVLELAADLGLNNRQTKQTKAIFNAMQTEASALGRQLVDKEQMLDEAFANGTITANTLQQLLSDIGKLQAQIRFVHLSAHLAQVKVLNHQQIRLYDHLRGYSGSDANNTAHTHGHMH